MRQRESEASDRERERTEGTVSDEQVLEEDCKRQRMKVSVIL